MWGLRKDGGVGRSRDFLCVPEYLVGTRRVSGGFCRVVGAVVTVPGSHPTGDTTSVGVVSRERTGVTLGSGTSRIDVSRGACTGRKGTRQGWRGPGSESGSGNCSIVVSQKSGTRSTVEEVLRMGRTQAPQSIGGTTGTVSRTLTAQHREWTVATTDKVGSGATGGTSTPGVNGGQPEGTDRVPNCVRPRII